MVSFTEPYILYDRSVTTGAWVNSLPLGGTVNGGYVFPESYSVNDSLFLSKVGLPATTLRAVRKGWFIQNTSTGAVANDRYIQVYTIINGVKVVLLRLDGQEKFIDYTPEHTLAKKIFVESVGNLGSRSYTAWEMY
jgi:hypothetical protein